MFRLIIFENALSTEILFPLLRIIKNNEGRRKDNKEKLCPVSM
jgi:hypothetical protein